MALIGWYRRILNESDKYSRSRVVLSEVGKLPKAPARPQAVTHTEYLCVQYVAQTKRAEFCHCFIAFASVLLLFCDSGRAAVESQLWVSILKVPEHLLNTGVVKHHGIVLLDCSIHG